MNLFWVDAFASAPFTGNPAAVVPLDHWPSDERMRSIAFENGLSETAFFVRTGPDRFRLRWFTPAVEVDLCGHATLASAFVIFSALGQTGESITFDSRSGPLPVRRLDHDTLELDFPATLPREETSPALRAAVADALGAEIVWLGRSPWDLVAVVTDPAALAALRPDWQKIHALGGRGVSVTARGGPDGIDFVSRWFGPQSGVNEDPVTGSAHCALLPFWSAQLRKNPLRARQLSRRTGDLLCTLSGDRARLAGRAILYLSGRIAV
jgi:PhzF family phenazine biosynthesis protein